MKKAVLVITDGIGHSENEAFNAFKQAKTPTYDWLFENVPHSLIRTYGESVGLPRGQMGNSEVGHMTLGSGRVLYQDLVRIEKMIANRALFENLQFQRLKECKNIHLVGLLSDGGVHSHLSHLLGILQELKKWGKDIRLHLISDGRDVLPQSLESFLENLKAHLDERIKIATLSGRYYAMDRDKRWERVQKAYEVMVLATPQTSQSIDSYIHKSYKEGVLDEFILPMAFDGYEGMQDGDGVLFFNFRSDRMRELTFAMGTEQFGYFSREKRDLYLLCMTEYDENFPLPTLVQKEILKGTLAEVVSSANLRQAHIAETEKYAHVTFFFNGGLEECYPKEERFLIPSPDVSTYDLKPQMSAEEVGERTRQCLKEGFDFVVVNFANGDMVGHTGVFNAGIKAVEAVDKELGRIIEVARQCGYSVVITSDHGNCEEMRDERGNILTNHTVGDVWCFVIDQRVQTIQAGTLANIAPTILKLMGLTIPSEMEKALF